MPKGPSATFPVTKNGKFIGYADARQIARNPSLAIYDETKAEALEQQAVVEAEKAAQEKAAEDKKVAEGKGANPADVKKGPAPK